jgi:poly(A) polymerase
VAFVDDWVADARRRDFTLNALYCGADGVIYDPLCGYADLVARRVRFIGVAAERIREDYLRILRFFRQTAVYGEGPADAEGLAACVRERAGLAMLSGERVREELLRLLVAPRGPEITALMQDYGLITAVLGAAPRPTLLARLAALEASVGFAPDAVLRLAALAVEVEEDALNLRERLRLSNDETAALLRAVICTSRIDSTATEAAAKACLYRLGPKAYRERVLVAWARAGDPPQSGAWRRLLALPQRWRAPIFPFGGDEVLAAGVPAGPRVGELLRSLEDWWIAGDFGADEGTLRAKLRKLLTGT